MAYAVIRVRGHPGVNQDIEDTMQMLNLTRVNHCVVVPGNDSVKGMIDKIKDYVTYGEVSEKTLARLIKFKGRLEGDRPIDDNFVIENSDFTSIISFAKGIVEGKAKYSDLSGVKPIFRLNPPRKGYEGIKRSFKNGGALGYRGEEINVLIDRMI